MPWSRAGERPGIPGVAFVRRGARARRVREERVAALPEVARRRRAAREANTREEGDVTRTTGAFSEQEQRKKQSVTRNVHPKSPTRWQTNCAYRKSLHIRLCPASRLIAPASQYTNNARKHARALAQIFAKDNQVLSAVGSESERQAFGTRATRSANAHLNELRTGGGEHLHSRTFCERRCCGNGAKRVRGPGKREGEVFCMFA